LYYVFLIDVNLKKDLLLLRGSEKKIILENEFVDLLMFIFLTEKVFRKIMRQPGKKIELSKLIFLTKMIHIHSGIPLE